MTIQPDGEAQNTVVFVIRALAFFRYSSFVVRH
jgi:hypothetical protein